MLFRFIILILSFILGYTYSYINMNFNSFVDWNNLKYGFYGFSFASLFLWLEIKLHQVRINKIFFSSIGLVIGFLIGNFITHIFFNVLDPFLIMFINIFFAYFGFIISFLKEEEFLSFLRNLAANQNTDQDQVIRPKILDTSVIIDGRIIDIAETGFLEGVFIVPKFVLNELQMVADSSDPLKRNRGRRGLDILNKIKTSKKVFIKIVDIDFPEINEVDAKLLKLAKKYQNAVIITNDFNLNKVAELEEIAILNINELTSSVKPVLLPNEELKITIIKEGKDQNQGIGYLEDGTMIVVDNGKYHIGKEAKVTVNSILQTSAGRMIFTQITTNDKDNYRDHRDNRDHHRDYRENRDHRDRDYRGSGDRDRDNRDKDHRDARDHHMRKYM